VEGYYTTCTGNTCSITVAGKEPGGFTINADAPAGAPAADGTQLVYAHGQQTSLMAMASTRADTTLSSALSLMGEGTVSYLPPAIAPALGFGQMLGAAAGGVGLAAAGGGGGSGSDGGGSAPVTVIKGNVLAGPVIPGHGLTATVYDSKGNQLGSSTVGDDGLFTFTFGGYSGPVLLRITDASSGVDYPALKLQVQHLLCGESAACPRRTTT
jgi:hypothetical protein